MIIGQGHGQGQVWGKEKALEKTLGLKLRLIKFHPNRQTTWFLLELDEEWERELVRV